MTSKAGQKLLKHLPEKSTLEIYRDCIRAVPLMNPNPVTISLTRQMIKDQFRRNRHVEDADEIDALRFV
mgnify:CR=1 FL=1